MVISWLTPINNHGLFVASMNAGRLLGRGARERGARLTCGQVQRAAGARHAAVCAQRPDCRCVRVGAARRGGVGGLTPQRAQATRSCCVASAAAAARAGSSAMLRLPAKRLRRGALAAHAAAESATLSRWAAATRSSTCDCQCAPRAGARRGQVTRGLPSSFAWRMLAARCRVSADERQSARTRRPHAPLALPVCRLQPSPRSRATC
jgi:hypothetical protein